VQISQLRIICIHSTEPYEHLKEPWALTTRISRHSPMKVFQTSRALTMKVSTENATPQESSKSRNSNFSVQLQIKPPFHFEFTGGFRNIWVSRFGGFWGCCIFSGNCHLWCARIGEYFHVGWLRLVGSFKLSVSFAKEPCKRDYVLQKRLIIWRSLLIVATPYEICA